METMDRRSVREHTDDSQIDMPRAGLCADTVHTKPDEKGPWAQGPHTGKGWTPKKQEQICLAGASREGGRRRNRPREARPDALALWAEAWTASSKGNTWVWRSERDKDRRGSEDIVLDLV